MEFDFDNMSYINLKEDEISDNYSLINMISLLNEGKKQNIKNKAYDFENNQKNNKMNNIDNIIYKQNNLNNCKNLNDNNKSILNLIPKEEEIKTKANTDDKNYSIKMNSIKSDIIENEEIKNLYNNDAYFKYTDDYKLICENSNDIFDLYKFNNNCYNKAFEDNNLKKNTNKKLLRKKVEKVEKFKKVGKVENNFKTKKNENIFYDINRLYKKYKGKDKIYKMYENKKGFYEKNITIVEEGTPICIIYFKHEIITKIYMIIEQITFNKKDEILEILIQIKKNILNNI